jgi:two-component sensor histidine kinase/PAS domain-containing protein
MNIQNVSPSGIQTAPHLPWGSHLAQFFRSGEDLRELLVPYFKAGLENNEQCLLVAGEAFDADQARSALRAAVPDLKTRERDGQIEIVNGGEWYAAGEKLRPQELVRGLIQREQDALGLGYAGLRTNGNFAWVSRDQWPDFMEYEKLVQETVRGRRMICMCSYCSDRLRDGSEPDILQRHDWIVPIAASARLPDTNRASADTIADQLDARELLRQLDRQKQTFDLAMLASKMGTWRYTLADNVCIYDENAQRLYGLTDARFLHDEEGVKSKFHSEDLELMWARVAKALDPAGDGRYEVEYRVKQPDGSWRWLSAWGLVEFEGDGPSRKAIAIAGASRDLTERKQAEETQRLLLNELNHRIKNTFATVQAISSQTLRNASDLPSAKEALEHRIASMAQAHDLLTERSWTGARLTDIVQRILNTFAPTQLAISGPAVEVSARHALALSMALHELATNAIKYGALSCPEGQVAVQWRFQDAMLHLDWEERGGPPVTYPTRKGFGSRLLERTVRGLGGKAELDYDVRGLKCSITVTL